MKIGMVGLGKLGLPCALAMEKHGHEVVGVDWLYPPGWEFTPSPQFDHEVGVNELLKTTKLKAVTLKECVEFGDIIFVAVQTPHHKQYEGITPIPEKREDFYYDFLVKAVREIVEIKPESLIVVISTVLPGTINRLIKPLLKPGTTLVYNPYFIAMGTVIADFENPEFVLLGSMNNFQVQDITAFYNTIHNRPQRWMSIESAELTKVAYNTFIGMKIVFANTLMEICHKIPNANVEDVTNALKEATDRLISPKYLSAGMGDGGGCHPRDNIAMSWLARELKLSHDIFTDLMKAREDQTSWLADLIIDAHRKYGLPIVILGASYKADSPLLTGSPSLLLVDAIKWRGYDAEVYDPCIAHDTIIGNNFVIHKGTPSRNLSAIYFIGINHDGFNGWYPPSGSVVLDPWRMIGQSCCIECDGFETIAIGIGK